VLKAKPLRRIDEGLGLWDGEEAGNLVALVLGGWGGVGRGDAGAFGWGDVGGGCTRQAKGRGRVFVLQERERSDCKPALTTNRFLLPSSC